MRLFAVRVERTAPCCSSRRHLAHRVGQCQRVPIKRGLATVFLAEDLRHHRKVALKVLHAKLAAMLGTDRFLAEIATTANLQHPGILPLFDSGVADGLVYYWAMSRSLSTIRRTVSPDLEAALEQEHSSACLTLRTARADDLRDVACKGTALCSPYAR
jgi:serine/threonine protein kinase